MKQINKFIIISFLLQNYCYCIVIDYNNAFNADIDIDNDDDDDLIKINNNNNNTIWSSWSPWSPCSRICDGGITTSVRKCLSRFGCKNNNNNNDGGQYKRYKLCNMQPCIIKTNFRQTQCSSYNNKPYRGRYYEWVAFIDPTDPCSLTCKANGLNFVAKLSPFITDGTRCTPNSLDVCVSGKCMNVGCDLQLGSTKKIDNCGVCGGDSTSCKNHTYRWIHRYDTNCTTICLNNNQEEDLFEQKLYRTSTVVCIDSYNNESVDDLFCSIDEKPQPMRKKCQTIEHCKFRWITEEWSKCTKKCGTGYQFRSVYCVLDLNHNVKIMDKQCLKIGLTPKPLIERKCNVDECPQWYEGPWSSCSETCGNGIQQRIVECKDNQGSSSDKCDWQLKPIDIRNCSDISGCLNGKINSQEDSPNIIINSMINEPSYEIGEWSSCNVSCGIGHRKRSIKCKIYLDFSKTYATLPFNQCMGPKPIEQEICYNYDSCNSNDNDLDNNIDKIERQEENNNFFNYKIDNDNPNNQYEWKIVGFTKCSANCLGGIQETIIKCIDINDNEQEMPDEYCQLNKKPETYTKICNDQPCLPRWNISNYNECSKKCGEGGYQTRNVICIHEISRDIRNFIIVPDNECMETKPMIERKCNQFDCPARWDVQQWQKCSRQCDGGLKKRTIYCIKDFVIGGMRNVSQLECLKKYKKPKTTKQCNLKPCRLSTMMNMMMNKNDFLRKSKRNHQQNKLIQYKNLYKVQGEIMVLEGSRIKLLCPIISNNSSSSGIIIWLKGHEQIINKQDDKRFIIIDKYLKIRNLKLQDTGVYKCIYKINDNDDLQQQEKYSMFLHVIKHQKQKIIDDDDNLIINDDNKSLSIVKTTNELDNKSTTTLTTTIRPKRYGGIQELLTKFNRTAAIKSLNYYYNDDNGNLIETNGQLNWITTSWSNCTIPCGGFGFRVRHSQCYIRMDRMTKKLNDSHCLNAGLKKPPTFETCGLEPCSSWNVDQWSECQGCIDIHKGLQYRMVKCLNHNNNNETMIIVDESLCYQWNDKPIDKQECYHQQCLPIWKVIDPSNKSEEQLNNSTSITIRCVWNNLPNKFIDESYCDGLMKPLQ